MMMTKKELIEQYNKGILKDNAYYNPSAFDAFILVEWNEENCFGYYQYQDDEKEFFLVKVNILENGFYIRPFGKRLNADCFMRIR